MKTINKKSWLGYYLTIAFLINGMPMPLAAMLPLGPDEVVQTLSSPDPMTMKQKLTETFINTKNKIATAKDDLLRRFKHTPKAATVQLPKKQHSESSVPSSLLDWDSESSSSKSNGLSSSSQPVIQVSLTPSSSTDSVESVLIGVIPTPASVASSSSVPKVSVNASNAQSLEDIDEDFALSDDDSKLSGTENNEPISFEPKRHTWKEKGKDPVASSSNSDQAASASSPTSPDASNTDKSGNADAQSFFENIMNSAKEHPVKSIALLLGGIAALGTAGYGLKQLFNKFFGGQDDESEDESGGVRGSANIPKTQADNSAKNNQLKADHSACKHTLENIVGKATVMYQQAFSYQWRDAHPDQNLRNQLAADTKKLDDLLALCQDDLIKLYFNTLKGHIKTFDAAIQALVGVPTSPTEAGPRRDKIAGAFRILKGYTELTCIPGILHNPKFNPLQTNASGRTRAAQGNAGEDASAAKNQKAGQSAGTSQAGNAQADMNQEAAFKAGLEQLKHNMMTQAEPPFSEDEADAAIERIMIGAQNGENPKEILAEIMAGRGEQEPSGIMESIKDWFTNPWKLTLTAGAGYLAAAKIFGLFPFNTKDAKPQAVNPA